MTRGPRYPAGLPLAIPFALRRGHVMVFMAALMNLAELLITGNGLFVLVGVRFARRIRAGIAEIEAEFADAIAGLRLVPRSGPVSCELWIYSRHRTLRHFRVGNTRIEEIDSYGTPLDQLRVVAAPANANDQTGISPGPAPAGMVPGTAVPAADTNDPIHRWLKKLNAARKEEGSAGSAGVRRILDAGKPGEPAKQTAGKRPARKKGTGAVTDKPEKSPNPGDPPAGEAPASPSETGSSDTDPSCDGKSDLPEKVSGTGDRSEMQ